jgi:hypothetical protein
MRRESESRERRALQFRADWLIQSADWLSQGCSSPSEYCPDLHPTPLIYQSFAANLLCEIALPPKDNFRPAISGFVMDIEEGISRGVDRTNTRTVRLFDRQRDDGL